MNDNDLERQLRTRAGPREEGYVPARLPDSLDDARLRRRSPLMRAAVFVPAVAAGVLVVAIAGAVLSRGGPQAVGDGSPEPTAAATNGRAVACLGTDVALSAEPWGGAAGSRGTTVSVALKAGSPPCLISEAVSARIADANGAEVVQSLSLGMIRPERRLGSGDVFTLGVAWSNFCGDTPPEPLSLQIRFANVPDWLTADESVSSPQIPVPPCLGVDSPGNLSVTELQGAQ